MNQQLYVDECMYVYFINVVNLLEINILLLLLRSYDEGQGHMVESI